MMDDQLGRFIEAQHATNLKMTETLSRIEQAQKDSSRRMFGGDGEKGAIDYIAEKTKKMCDDTDKVSTRVTALETTNGNAKSWLAGVIAVLGLETTAVGFYLSKFYHFKP